MIALRCDGKVAVVKQDLLAAPERHGCTNGNFGSLESVCQRRWRRRVVEDAGSEGPSLGDKGVSEALVVSRAVGRISHVSVGGQWQSWSIKNARRLGPDAMLVHDDAPIERRVLVYNDLSLRAGDLGKALVAVCRCARDAEVELAAVRELDEAGCVVDVVVLSELLPMAGNQPSGIGGEPLNDERRTG